MPRPVHFEIHASDPTASRAFYEGVFGWRFQQWGDLPYWVVSTGDGPAMGSEEQGQPGIDEGQAVNAFVVTVDVPDCAASVDRALAAGGSVALPRAAMAGVGWLAYVKDPDGNLFGLMQADPAAA